MSLEKCMCKMCPNTSCAYDREAEIFKLQNQIADLESQLERANGILDTLKQVVNYILENA
jgi:hypothetical protein